MSKLHKNIAMSFTYPFPRPALTTDAVVICPEDATLLLIERKKEPFKGKWALPGGFVDEYEDVQESCTRELFEETNLQLNPIEGAFVGVFGKEGRDPRGWTVSVVYFFSIGMEQKSKVAPGSDSAVIKWFSITELPGLAFDHDEIIAAALKKDLN